MRKNPTPLALLALLAIAAAIMAGLAGKDAVEPDRAAIRDHTAPEEGRARKTERARPDPVIEVAADYALAARNWTPAGYRDSWERQIALAGGRYRRELEAKRPGAGELGALAQDRARSTARLVGARRDARVRAPAAVVLVTLNETTAAAGQTIRGVTVNQAQLRRSGGRWRVIGWTVLPGGASPGSGS